MRNRRFMEWILFLCILLLFSCSDMEKMKTYFGRLDGEIVVLSSGASGELIFQSARNGDLVQEGDVLAQVDSEPLEIQKRQLLAKEEALKQNLNSALSQIDQAETQLKFTRENLERTESLLLQGGASRQRRDELATAVEVGQSSLEMLRSQYRMLEAQQTELLAAVELADLAIEKARIQSPVTGRILNRFHRTGELVALGTPLFEVADLRELLCYVYLPLQDLAEITLDSEALIYLSGIEEPFYGKVESIASEAEFTPKTILTEETRETLVYEVSIRVQNPEEILKIGMPVDVTFR